MEGEAVKALVTGASGFVGAALARALIAAGWQVRVLVRASSDRRNLRALTLETVIGDLTDEPSLRRAVAGCDAVFHAAADYRLWVPNPQSMYHANVDGTRNLLNAAHRAGVSRIVYTSSVACVGLSADGGLGTEQTPVSLADMTGHYKRSKFLAEQVALEAAARGVPVVIVNPAAPVGPRDLKPTPTGQIVLDAALGRTPAYVDTGLNVVHVDDVAAGHVLAFHHGRVGERYILGGENLPLRAILIEITRLAGRAPPRLKLPHGLVLPIAYVAEGIARLSGKPTRVTVDSVRMARKRMYFSSEKAERELGYRSRPARLAFEDALEWFREEGYLQGRQPSGGRAQKG